MFWLYSAQLLHPVVRAQSNELTRGTTELVQHFFRLQGEFTSALLDTNLIYNLMQGEGKDSTRWFILTCKTAKHRKEGPIVQVTTYNTVIIKVTKAAPHSLPGREPYQNNILTIRSTYFF